MRNKHTIIGRGFLFLAVSAIVFIAGVPSNKGIAFQARSEFETRANSSNLLLRGLVDKVDLSKSRILVLGQWVPVPRRLISSQLVRSLAAIYGSINPNGTYRVSSLVNLGSSTYVAGATRLFVKGQITSIDYANGTARIGLLTVDYTAALYSLNDRDLAAGMVASFRGLQYLGIARFFADSGQLSASGVGNAQGQTGSGSEVMGQTGSGSQTLGQTGSGSQTLGQTGSGSQTLGQTGSGSQTLGQTGSGSQTLGQTGSGSQTLGQTGSGSQTLGQTGSGSQIL